MKQARTTSTDLDNTEKTLRAIEKKYRLAMEAVNDGLWDWNVESGYVYYSPAWCRILGENTSDAIYAAWEDRIHPEDKPRVIQTLEAHLAGRLASWEEEFRLRKSDESWVWVLGRGRVVERSAAGNPLRMVGTMTDISRRKQAEDDLKASEQFNKSIVESSSDCIAVLNRQGRVSFINKLGRNLLSAPDMHQYLDQPYEKFWEGNGKILSRDAIEHAVSGNDARFTGFTPTTYSTPKWWDVTVTPIFGANQKVEKLLAIARDITQRKQSADALQASERRLKEAEARAHIGYWILESDMKTLACSDEVCRILGVDATTPLTLSIAKERIHPDDREEVTTSLEKSMREAREHSVEYRIIRPNGDQRWVVCKASPVFDDGGTLVRFAGLLQDITEQKCSEIRLRTSLREKETLLREVHHRVKNNLQIVDSLLYLQARVIGNHTDQVAIDAFRQSQSRIKSMAKIHDRLYRSGNLSSIDFGEYLSTLLPQLLDFFQAADRIATRIESDSLHLPVDEAIPCALIVNELFTNSLKHAFPNDKKGTVSIRIQRLDNGRRELAVEDDGVGISEEHTSKSPLSLGLRLVSDLVGQLDGALSIENDNGTRIRIVF